MGWQTLLTQAQNRAAEEHCSSVEQGHPGEPAVVSQHIHLLSEQKFAQECYTLVSSTTQARKHLKDQFQPLKQFHILFYSSCYGFLRGRLKLLHRPTAQCLLLHN